MKFVLSLFFSVVAAASAKTIEVKDVKANSHIGRALLSKARNLENDEAAMDWAVNYSLKFQGCHHLYQWNDEAEDEEDVRLEKKRLVRFRLCPSDSCSASDAGGCKNGYGDYVVDMGTYVQAYYESKTQQIQETCENFLENNCNCEDNGDDQYDEAVCQYNCVAAAGLEECYEFVQEEEEGFDAQEYMECAQWEPAEQDDEGRKLEDGEEEAWYVGPYCSEQGGKIFLGLFTDDTCTTFADDYAGTQTYKSLSYGAELPYSEESLVDEDCFSCMQVDQDNDQQAYEINDACQQTYQAAGKCETYLDASYEKVTSACNYIKGITIVREDGLITVSPPASSPVATAFTVIFVLAFAGMGYYVWYLRTRLGMKTDTLL